MFRTALFVFVLLGGTALAAMLLPPSAARWQEPPAKTSKGEHEFVPGEILVRFREDAAATKVPSALSSVMTADSRHVPLQIERLGPDESVPGLRIARVAPEDTMQTIASLRLRSDVLYAEPNYLLYEDIVPNDTRYPEMYNLNNTGQSGGVVGADIDAELAWNLTTGSSNVVVGIVDSGIDINHPDLQANIWINPGEVPNNGVDDDQNGYVDDVNGWDFYNNDKTVFDSPSIDDHGTHVAGTVGAVGNDSLGVVGVNWQVKLMPLKFLGSDSGSGPTSAAIAAINYAKEMASRGEDLRVLNNSWGGGNKSQALLDAINALHGAGILFVAAAGNDSTDNFYIPHYPASFDQPNIISVASTDSNDVRSSFSNFGRTVTLGAPGSSILSTMPGGSYGLASGTSMAAPHVSGAAALLLSISPNITLPRLVGCLSYGGDHAFSATRTRKRLNVYRSILSAQENDSTPPAPVGNLHVEVTAHGRDMHVSWNAPGDDGNSGTAADYDVFFVDLASGIRTLLPSNEMPGAPGTSQLESFLPAPYGSINGTIEVRTYDNVGNVSISIAAVSLDVYSNDRYIVSFTPASFLSSGGVRLPLDGDDESLTRSLPFQFPFFRNTFLDSATISTNGFLYFPQTGNAIGSGNPNDLPSAITKLSGRNVIAGLWDDLVIDNTGSRPNDGVYEVKPNPDTVIYRWQGVTFDSPNTAINFEIELSSNGTVIYRYGDGNTNIFPVVALSAGGPYPYAIQSHTTERDSGNPRKDLGNAQTVTFTPRPPPPPNTFDLGTDNYIVTEDGGSVLVTVTRGANTVNGLPILGRYSVDYLTGSGTATTGADFTSTSGTLTFDGDARQTFRIPIINDYDFEPNETFTLTLSNPTNGSQLGVRTSAIVTILNDDLAPANPIDDSRNFIRQHYLDFLNREPDQGGWDYWTFNITQCGNDTRCIHNRRIDVSAAFFIELEFQETGYVVYRLHRAAFGTLPSGPTRANVVFTQFMADRGQLVPGPGLPQSTINFANTFVQRAEFLTAFPAGQSNEQFVNKLFDTAGLTPFASERQQQIDAMSNNGKTRAQVLLDVIEIPAFKTREYNGAFVLMQYFGYLRRDPDQGGYDFWLGVLNNQELNNYRGMVCAFLTSAEYQRRFGTTVTRTDRDCGP